MKPKVLLTRSLPSSVLARLEAACDVDLFRGGGPVPRAEFLARVAGKEALLSMVTDTVDRAVIDAGTELRVIANVAVGYNNIDVAAARERGITVTNTPDVLTDATADFTMALMLAVTRRLGEGERMVRRGDWKGWAFDQLLGMQLRGKQLGIVGFGRIGRAVAARAAAFGMTVVHSLRSGEGLALDRLLATSDVVSLHVPLSPDTRHLIGQPELARMKRSAYLINTTRGLVVDEAALAWALKNRIISGAALDVYEREPEIHPDLLPLENVVLAPHLGSATTETRTAMADLAARNVVAVLSGEPPLTPVA
ncbi:MAG: D-glycerate dehydrogenase [Acidobacteria bacterium RIFCSPLOWO2_02_FULL_67_21]|nr:MAG: D-glycerate dehydrogenase [Acidobacteria bacterium RIFCSPLOWO2_02_FULL_67_21]